MIKRRRLAAGSTAGKAKAGRLTGRPIHKKQRHYNDPAVPANAVVTDDASDADRDWFATNPSRNYRLRPIAASELAFDDHRRPPDGSGLVAYAIVKQFRPGLRLRVYFMSPPFHRIENIPDAAFELLWAVVQEQYRQMPDIIDALSLAGGR